MDICLRKKFARMELGGVLFALAASAFMRDLYAMSGKELIGVLFGAVNESIWEQCKTLLLPCLLWAMLELLCIQPSLHRLAAAKTASLYLLGISYISGRLLMMNFTEKASRTAELSLAAVCLCLAYAASCILYFSRLELHRFFAPSLFLLFLLLALYFSFTPFPPRNPVFEDPETGLYGIIPDYIDKGAIVLDTLYFYI